MPQSSPPPERTGVSLWWVPLDASSAGENEAARADARAASNLVIELL
jgi:hypothetical protein